MMELELEMHGPECRMFAFSIMSNTLFVQHYIANIARIIHLMLFCILDK